MHVTLYRHLNTVNAFQQLEGSCTSGLRINAMDLSVAANMA